MADTANPLIDAHRGVLGRAPPSTTSLLRRVLSRPPAPPLPWQSVWNWHRPRRLHSSAIRACLALLIGLLTELRICVLDRTTGRTNECGGRAACCWEAVPATGRAFDPSFARVHQTPAAEDTTRGWSDCPTETAALNPADLFGVFDQLRQSFFGSADEDGYNTALSPGSSTCV